MKEKRANAPRPVVEAVSMTWARVRLGRLVQRAFGDRTSFVLERDGVPLVALVDARTWLAQLEVQFPGIRGHIVRGAASRPRRNRSRGQTAKTAKKTKPVVKRSRPKRRVRRKTKSR